jgi:hypothetical protein
VGEGAVVGYLLVGRAARRRAVSKEFPHNDEARAAGEKSERLLEDTYLSGAVGMGAAGPRLSASALGSGDDEGIQVHEDSSWKSHAVEEGDPGNETAASGGGLRGALRRLFAR